MTGLLWVLFSHRLSLPNLSLLFPHPPPPGMAALNGGLGSSGLSNGTGSTMEALTQAYSGIQQYAAAALPTLYNQNLLAQQSIGAAGSQKEGECGETGVRAGNLRTFKETYDSKESFISVEDITPTLMVKIARYMLKH